MNLKNKLKLAKKLKNDALYAMGIDEGEGKYRSVRIIAGREAANKVEIVKGLKENDKVITTGQQILKHESIIEVVGNEDIAKVPAAGKDAATQNTNVAANP